LAHARWLAERFPGCAWIAVELLCGPNDRAQIEGRRELGTASGLPLVAAGGVHMHVRSRRRLQDTLTAIRLRVPVDRCGHALYPNAERHLRLRLRLANLYPAELLAETLNVAERCTFALDSLRYEYPEELVPEGETPASHLRRLTEEGLKSRCPQGTPEHVKRLVEHELALIAELRYEPYFLTVHDIVKFARERNILCQGRGSAANSAVCYALGITEVDPARMNMLFERFVSRERNEPPDIDVDFEHQRREEVIQYLYGKYGRHRAALAATVISYRPKSALRDAGRALGLDRQQVDRLSKTLAWWDDRSRLPERLREAGFDPASPVMKRLLDLAGTLIGFPRHLSQHVGGFVITRDRLSRLVPIENAAMPERSVIQWDKDDLDALGLLKVDILGLGMLSAIRRALDLIGERRAGRFTMSDVPPEDPAVYEMIRRADTMGVFQIESRAQMSMLPRLAPEKFYDLVIEVAIVRPGPIQGGMVHPYLRRRQGLEPVTYPSDAVREILSRTLGVPIFQEQVMQLAVVAAGFTPGEADQLRRSMAAWRRKGGLDHFQERLIRGMSERGYEREFAERIYQQILGFGEYGFPESHSASFALLVYVSAWIKRMSRRRSWLRCSTASPWVFMHPRSWCRMRAGTASRCGRWMCWQASGNAGSNIMTAENLPSDWRSAWCKACRRRVRSASLRHGTSAGSNRSTTWRAVPRSTVTTSSAWPRPAHSNRSPATAARPTGTLPASKRAGTCCVMRRSSNHGLHLPHRPKARIWSPITPAWVSRSGVTPSRCCVRGSRACALPPPVKSVPCRMAGARAPPASSPADSDRIPHPAWYLSLSRTKPAMSTS